MRISSVLQWAVLVACFGLVAGCSSTKTAGGGEASDMDSSGAQSSAVDTRGVSSAGMSDSGSTNGMPRSFGNTIYFDFDQDTIRPDGRDVLMGHAARLRNGGRAVLEGHADERGSREYNIALGERRAKAVRDFLVIQGVNSSQLEVVSYGEERPADSGSNEMAWAKNRRVEIK